VQIGSVIAGRYELGAPIGSGGFATVYRAFDAHERRDVAIKVIPSSFGSAVAVGAELERGAREDATAQFERFRQEALALSRLRSRHVARVHHFGRDEGVGLYLVMELIDGVPLDAESLGRALLAHEVLRVARGMLAGLAEAHAHGIVHRDIKPTNVIVPRGRRGLDEVRLLDFGIARDERRAAVLAEALGRTEGDDGIVLGTPAFMAPEQLRGDSAGAGADVYSAGLVLFDLLCIGPLLPGTTLRDQLMARLTTDVALEGRVPPPLGTLLAKMLARDPDARFQDAGEALEAIGDLETAPVSMDAMGGLVPPLNAPMEEDGDTDERTTDKSGQKHALFTAARASEESSSHERLRDGTPFPPPPAPSVPAASSRIPSRPSPPGPAFAFGARRLSRLARDPNAALGETLHALDLAMVDALARRERGAPTARIARAVALALRLELDAAALVLEPLAGQNDLARAFGASLVAPRARRATRARVDADKTDAWVDTIDLELGAMLVSLATCMTLRDDATRCEQRCRRLLERAGDATSATLTTVRMAQISGATLAGTLNTTTAIADLLRLRDTERDAASPFNLLVRGLLLGVTCFRADEHLSREQLERATKLAAETGNTLLEARALVTWGGMLVEIPERVEHGLSILDRATTLLAHGDAPSLEHIAEHNRGAALIIQGRYAESAPHLRRARHAAKGELSLEHEMLSCMNEGLSHVCLGDREASARIVDELSDARLAQCSARTGAYSHVVRSMFAMLFETPERANAELRRAHARAAEADAEGADAYLLAEALGILYASARHEEIDLLARAGELQKLAQDRGFVSFYWFDVLRAMVKQMKDVEMRATVGGTLEKLVVLLGPASSIAPPR
jgi:serine/threonine protein kinase